MEDAGLFIIGAVLQILLCKGEADKLECRPMHPQQFETGQACVEAAQGMAASISAMEPEMFGLPKGTKLSLKLRCRPLFGEREA
jgi:hypothetical protein